MTKPSIEEEDEIVLKVLHTADWHLGKRFGSFPEADAMKLTRARLEVLDSVFGLAERNAVDAVLCAGDLFDDPFPGKDWWLPLTDMLGKLAWKDRPMFMLPGNHDPLVAESVWSSGHAFRRALPSFVHVIDRDDFTYTFGDTAVLYAVPCMSKAGQRDPSDAIPCREPGDTRIRIGMMHGSTFDMEEHQTNFPIGEDSAVRRGLDYLAIGDTHGFRYVPPNRRVPPTIYPGAPEPTAFDEKEPGHVALVNFTKRREATVHKTPVAAWTWEDVTVKSLAELQALRDRRDLGKRCLQLHVEMRLAPAEYEQADALLRELQGTSAMIGRAGILVLDRAGMELDTTDMETLVAGWPEVLVRTANLIKADREADPRVMQQALYKLYELSRRP
jgi:DNA repair exonuclease SbcCD nuclease subunit